MSNPDLALAESVSTTNAYYFIAVYILILIYCCFGLAVVCDVYFVPALQKLSQTYDLPPDIAGSTLMALGASVPELFASLIGVFVTEDDIGTGSIIGSSCFNLIAVPAACAFVASAAFTQKLSISPMPVIRNSAFYAITILVLLLIIKDNKVDILEASILLIFFVLYMALMIFSAQNSSRNRSRSRCSSHYAAIGSGGHSCSLSNSSSYNSSCADSAIAGCNQPPLTASNSRRNSSGSGGAPAANRQQPLAVSAVAAPVSNKNIAARVVVDLNNNLNQVPMKSESSYQHQQQILGNYGQFYFAVKPAATDYDGSNSTSKASERTPLVPPIQHHHHQQQQSPVYHYYSDDNGAAFKNSPLVIEKNFRDDSCVSVDLGAVAIKNSACLASSFKLNRKQQFDDDSIGKLKRQQRQQSNDKSAYEDDDEMGHEENWVSSKWILVPMLPLTLGMKILIPCKFKNTFWTIWTFIISIALIGGLTYVSVCMVSMFGQVIGIPETVAGMTILSWGTGIPELIASIVLIKKTAKADMAICNTIGSNVIDVSFCLSLPWIVKCLMSKTEGFKPEVEIQSAALPWTCFTLLLSVVLLLLILKLHDWVLDFSVGCWLMVVYVAFVGLATYLESTFAKDGIDLMALF